MHGITQGEDGYLWVATDRGLVRFDGLTFQLTQPLVTSADMGPTVLGVAPDPDGSVWARLKGPAVLRYRHREFEQAPRVEGRPQSVVTAMIRARDGAILMATLGEGIIAYRQGRFTTLASPQLMPRSFAISIAETPDGVVWLGTRDIGLLRVEKSQVTRITEGLPDPKINCLLSDDNGDLWIGTDRGVVRWHGGHVTRAGVPDALLNVPTLAMVRDRESNIWVAAGARGLLRVNGRGVLERRGQEFGLPGNVTSLFEDRDGNLWIGMSGGLARMRDAVFTSYTTTQGLPSDSAGPLYVDEDQRTWFAPAQGGLAWVRDGQVGRVTGGGLSADVVYSIGGGGGRCGSDGSGAD